MSATRAAGASRGRDARSSSHPLANRRGGTSSPLAMLSNIGFVVVQLFILLPAVSQRNYGLQSSNALQFLRLHTSSSDGDKQVEYRSSGYGLMVADGASYLGLRSGGSRLMPRYECCCHKCPRRPCFICRNVDYSCNCVSCSCYADSMTSTSPPPPVYHVDDDDDDDGSEYVDTPMHRIRHGRYRHQGGRLRGGFNRKTNLGVTQPAGGNAFIDRLLQRHAVASVAVSKRSSRDQRD